jgi:hypothetical protein
MWISTKLISLCFRHSNQKWKGFGVYKHLCARIESYHCWQGQLHLPDPPIVKKNQRFGLL